MFRATQNAFDDAVGKATDENLTAENWEYILDVCDKVNVEDTGAKDAVAALIKRLAHRNANVQLYTLELANALSQNCGSKVHRELASRSFTEALLRLAADRNTHRQVKSKIIERMAEWTEMFSKNPDFGIMEQAYMKLKSQNPTLQAPSKPTKRHITEADRLKEEEELQMALALSIKDKSSVAPSDQSQPNTSTSSSSISQNQAQSDTPHPIPSGTTAATVSRVRALYDFQPSEAGELQFRKGDIIAVLESVYKDWWKGSLRGQTGIFPLNYVEKLPDPTTEDLQREAQMEAEVFGQIKNVEKLLTLLSTSSSDLNVQDNEEITTLYHATLAIRPKLIELIGKYSQKKDEFTQLNEKFIKARRDYESLLEASMSHPVQNHYSRPVQTQYAYPTGSTAAQGYPAATVQHDPQRFYTPRPQDGPPSQTIYSGSQGYHHADQSHHGYSTTAQSSDPRIPTPATNQTYPPQAQTQSPVQSQQPPPQSQADSFQTIHHRPQSTYEHPQELGTSVYDSPADQRQSFHPGVSSVQQQLPQGNQQHFQQPGNEYPPPVSPQEEPHRQSPNISYAPYQPQYQLPQQPQQQQHQQQQQQPQAPYPTSVALPIHPPPPNQQPPADPSGSPQSSQATPYPSLNIGQPAPGTYQQYQQQPAHSVNANPTSFYR
jgi:signal transducing adaptor molecule